MVVTEVSKRFPLFARRWHRVRVLVGNTRGLSYVDALRGVSFEAAPGEAVGLIGENGSGKSTLLRLVAGITRPDQGRVVAVPPVAAILELGLGFHPEFTGRDNARLYAVLVGVPEAELDERLQAALAFSELGEFIDHPLRTYSTGMSARLAFAVATHVEPSVLVVDEALAVGDGAFQKKCVDRMVRFKEEGRTVLFCSHAMYQVAAFCERSVWLHQGRVAAAGPSREVIHAYEEYLRHRGKRQAGTDRAEPAALGAPAAVTGVEMSPPGGRVAPGESLEIRVGLRRCRAGLPVHVAVVLEDQDGACVSAFATHWDGRSPLAGGEREQLSLVLPTSPLARGSLDVTVFLMDDTGLQLLDQVLVPRGVQVQAPRWTPGLVEIPHHWTGQGAPDDRDGE